MWATGTLPFETSRYSPSACVNSFLVFLTFVMPFYVAAEDGEYSGHKGDSTQDAVGLAQYFGTFFFVSNNKTTIIKGRDVFVQPFIDFGFPRGGKEVM